METTFSVENLNVHFGSKHVLKDVTIEVPRQAVTAIIGASGCGKSTFLRCLNRMNDLAPDFKMRGQVQLDGRDIYAPRTDVIGLRRRVGMVFQRPNPFPKSIFDNVAYGLRIQGMRDRRRVEKIVQDSLQQAALWEEVKAELKKSALHLSGGQQQRLCIARTVATAPEVILFDEPCSALDPIATRKVEELIMGLKDRYTIIVVTHNLQQARRVADYVGFFHLGKLVEFGKVEQVFEGASEHITREYVKGSFG